MLRSDVANVTQYWRVGVMIYRSVDAVRIIKQPLKLMNHELVIFVAGMQATFLTILGAMERVF